MRLILATSSATRCQLLRQADIAFDAMPARVDEEAIRQSLIAEGASATRGSQSAMSVILKGVLYRGAGRTPLARFDFHARSKKVPELATQVVEKWKAGGYL